jgi:hypothetical protein
MRRRHRPRFVAKLQSPLLTLANATTPHHLQLWQPTDTYEMASINAPRAAMHSLSRAAPSLQSKAPRIATRCLHQKASPITASPLQHRPKIQQWSQNTAPVAATVSRRTMFIQTEPTPNADVRVLLIKPQ